jgi:hypothetical protein
MKKEKKEKFLDEEEKITLQSINKDENEKES